MATKFYNPENIVSVLHKKHGQIVLADNQAIQAHYAKGEPNSIGSLKKVEIWQEDKPGLPFLVMTMLGKSILMTFTN